MFSIYIFSYLLVTNAFTRKKRNKFLAREIALPIAFKKNKLYYKYAFERYIHRYRKKNINEGK